MIRVLLADDQALVRGGLRKIVDTEPDMTVVAEAADGLQAVDAARASKPDVAVLDIRMPHLDGIEATRRIVAALGDDVRVLMLTTFGLDDYVFGKAGERFLGISRVKARIHSLDQLHVLL